MMMSVPLSFSSICIAIASSASPAVRPVDCLSPEIARQDVLSSERSGSKAIFVISISLRQFRQRPCRAVVRVAEPGDRVAEAVRERKQQAIVRDLRELERAAHFESEAVAYEHERNVVQ